MFVMGACGIIYEYVLSVLGNHLIGSSHEEIFIVIGLMMFAMGMGSFAQRNIRKDLFDWFLRIEIFLGLVGGFAATIVHLTFATSESYRVVLYSFAFLIGFLIGMEIPVLIRVNKQYSKSLRTNLSEILSMDYVGALAGALLFTYLLLTQVSLARIAFLLGITNVVIGIVGLIAFRPLVRRPGSLAAFCLLALVALSYGMLRANDWTEWGEQRYFADPIVHRETSKYQHIVLTEQSQRLNLYLNGHLQFSSEDERIYHELLVHPALTLREPSEPLDVLILGGGDGLALREVLRYPNVKSVTLVELDPAVVRLAREHPRLVEINEGSFEDERVAVEDPTGVSEGPEQDVSIVTQRISRKFQEDPHPVARVKVILIDADLFLQSAGPKYDAAFVDFPDPGRIEIAKLYSKDFYRSLQQRLKPGATIAVQSTSPFHAKLVFLCIGETLRSADYTAVPYHQNVPSFGEWGFHIAQPGAGKEASLVKRLRSIQELRVPTQFVTPHVIAASTVFGKNWLVPSEPIEPNTKMDPVILRYFRQAWQGY